MPCKAWGSIFDLTQVLRLHMYKRVKGELRGVPLTFAMTAFSTTRMGLLY